ncbi:MAG: hypothetical protein EBU82_03865 [Flavobacteriia bacterium]|nr:hypothetical protein [Flavobacteriia bacterium]
MTSKKHKKLKILWVGETAFEAYQSTDMHVRKSFNHEILMYEPSDKKSSTKINYLKNKEDPQLKEIKEPKSYYGTHEKSTETHSEYMLFEPTLFKKEVTNGSKAVIEDAVFLKIKALFLDFEEALGSTTQNYGKYFKQTWEIDQDAPIFDEFLFKYLENKTSNNP